MCGSGLQTYVVSVKVIVSGCASIGDVLWSLDVVFA